MASRKLTVEFIGDTSSLDKAFRKVDGSSKGLGKSFGVVAKGAGLAGVAIGGALAVGVTKATQAFYESNKIAKQTNAVLKSTGEAAHVTAKQVGDLATALSKKTGVDDEAIQSGENLLLTFTKIRNETGKGNDVFNRATKTIVDMSAALGQDMKSSAIQVGKALNDPIKGVTALQRVGVSFTAAQKEQIKGLVEHGKTLEAQKLILHELNTEFGGSAAAQATNMDRLKVSLGNLQESVGAVFVPMLEKAAAGLNKFVDGMMSGTGAGGRLVQILKEIGTWLGGAFSTAVQTTSAFLKQHHDDLVAVAHAMMDVGNAIRTAAIAAFNALVTAGNAVSDWYKRAKPDLVQFGEALRNVAIVVKDVTAFAFTHFLVPALEVLWSVVKRIWPAIQTMVTGVLDVLKGAIRVFSGILTGDFGKAWQGVKDIFKGSIEVVLGALRGMTAPAREIIARIGKGIGDAFSAMWDGIKNVFTSGVNAVIGFLNDLIDAINKIPGVNIGHIGKIGGTARPGQQNLGQTGHLAEGGIVNRPTVVMGEEAPRYPEWVIPTNPAYRDRAQGLLAQAASSIGMARGGVVGLAKGGRTGGSGLPSVSKLPGMFKGLGHYLLGKAAAYIKDQTVGFFTSPGSGPISGPGAVGGGNAANQKLGKAMMLAMGWPASQWPALRALWIGESGWSTTARNESSGAYGIPQSLPASKMASAGADWLTNPRTQIKWGLGYIRGRYGSPSGAYSAWLGRNPHWYAKGGLVPGLKKGGKSSGPKKGGKLSGPNKSSPWAQALVSVGGGRFVTVAEYARMIAAGYDPSDTSRQLGPVTGPPSPASDETVDKNTEAADRLAELLAQKIELDKLIAANQDKILALTKQGPEILAAVVAAVNGGIGGPVGLGFQSPSYPGGMARYR